MVKGGEDVRIDERIQQLFVVMAGLAAQHPGCAARRLQHALATYDVVPASPRLGLLGFVEVGFAVGAGCCASMLLACMCVQRLNERVPALGQGMCERLKASIQARPAHWG